MAIKTFKRYERKYMVNEFQLVPLLNEIQKYMLPDKYCIDGKKYRISNVYYDNDENEIIRTSLSKPYYKEKLRLRSYYSFSKPDEIIFAELKKKIGGIVSKRRASMSLAAARALIEHSEISKAKNYEDRQVATEILYFSEGKALTPKAYIRYDRQAFFGKDNPDFRLTIDDNICSRRTGIFNDSDALDQSLLEPGKYILEIKISDSIPMWLSAKLSELGIRRVNFSKYGNVYKSENVNTLMYFTNTDFAPITVCAN